MNILSPILPISVVIPTIGTREIKPTLDSIFNGSHIPEEVLLCVPSALADTLSNYKTKRIVIIPCSKKGQVIQRIEGFKKASSEYVLQLDDDIVLDKDCLLQLYTAINELGRDCAISPQYYDIISGTHYSTSTPEQIIVFPRLFYYLLNGKKGYESGKISKSGINMGVRQLVADYHPSEWLSGGCILHRKENLILRNYIPFTGKAYAEDVMHSYMLKKDNIKLYVVRRAKIFMKCHGNGNGALKSLHEYFNSIKLSYYAASFYEASYVRYSLSKYYYLINVLVSKIFSVNSKYNV